MQTNPSVVEPINLELKQATFLALSPEEVDFHGDIYSEVEVRKACHNFNRFCGVANLMHLVDCTAFEIIESYICPADITLNDVSIQKGSWLTVLQFNDDTLWESVKSGEFTGVSIGALAEATNLDNTED